MATWTFSNILDEIMMGENIKCIFSITDTIPQVDTIQPVSSRYAQKRVGALEQNDLTGFSAQRFFLVDIFDIGLPTEIATFNNEADMGTPKVPSPPDPNPILLDFEAYIEIQTDTISWTLTQYLEKTDPSKCKAKYDVVVQSNGTSEVQQWLVFYEDYPSAVVSHTVIV